MNDEVKILSKVYHNKDNPDFELSQSEKDIFREGNFVEQLKAMGSYVGEKFEDGKSGRTRYRLAPTILSKLYSVIGQEGYRKLGIPGNFYHMKAAKGNENHKRTIKRNLKYKIPFNHDLHDLFKQAHLIRMMFGDLDFLGPARSIKNRDLRGDYTGIGDNFLESIEYAITENDAKVDVHMEIFSREHSSANRYPIAQGNAKKVAETGANTYDYYDGNHCGVIFTDDLTNDYKEQLLNVVNYISCIKDITRKDQKIKELSKSTGLTQKKIKEVIGGTNKLNHWEAKAIEHFYRDVLYPSGDANGDTASLDPKIKLIENENKIYYTLTRDFYEKRKEKQSEEPQMHKGFWAAIFPEWDAAANHMNQYMDTIPKGDPIPAEDL
jgi:hypothetical protein